MAGVDTWLAGHSIELLQTVILTGGLFAAVKTLREDKNERKIHNLLAINAAHREIWSAVYDRPQLNRIFQSGQNFIRQPMTADEQLFVHFLILHLRASFKARCSGMEFDDDDVAADIRQFFAQPIPRQVWEVSKKFQDPDFVKFVESKL